ncbi:MAG TPA: zinc-dependent alcohol dehydrogenase [Anaeromyxobacteraceae bacterium]|nr:zinc-dependent alcohol dehydrogenase [Anaeromyxobacteraceae bacterium]
MRAVVFHGIGDVRLDEVKDPEIREPTDAIVRITRSAICGTDLHFVRGTVPGMKAGTVLGHEAVGVVEEVGKGVRNFQEGDRVVVPSTIACGNCVPCKRGFFAQCDRANPNGPEAGTAFYGGPQLSGPFDGLQAERQRIALAHVNLVKLPDEVSDDQAILVSDIFPTGWFGTSLADVAPGTSVAVFGCGPVGQFAIASAFLRGAARVIAVDAKRDRLEAARAQGAECIDYEADDPVKAVKELTAGSGVDAVIDAVGVDANAPRSAPREAKKKGKAEAKEVAPEQRPHDGNWHPGDAPSQALAWGVEVVCKAGTLAVIGVYPPTARAFPIGQAMNKNLSVKMGNCNHRKYIPLLLERVRTGAIDPSRVVTQEHPLESAIEAYQQFDQREPGWLKVEILPAH